MKTTMETVYRVRDAIMKIWETVFFCCKLMFLKSLKTGNSNFYFI